jgi:hypothetical protein
MALKLQMTGGKWPSLRGNLRTNLAMPDKQGMAKTLLWVTRETLNPKA